MIQRTIMVRTTMVFFLATGGTVLQKDGESNGEGVFAASNAVKPHLDPPQPPPFPTRHPDLPQFNDAQPTTGHLKNSTVSSDLPQTELNRQNIPHFN
ncbi:Hypothetical predicted protein [Cloeon dipterum]|uniref:Uncharacterized protein n=1 Tax=Cloeon dipterum TaxID=197152 RepID=A0A8S1C8D0_9INSE|nr:Hypothetical predicted protein [Cloeon dipterum]